MILRYFTLLFTILSTLSFAQVNVGSELNPSARSTGGELRRNDVRKLARTKTVFFYGEKDKNMLEDYKKVMKEVWTASTIEFDDIANFGNYEKARNISFITMELEPVVEVNTNLGRKETVGFKAYYHFYIPGSQGPETFARVDLFLNYEDDAKLLEISKDKKESQKNKDKNMKAYLYKHGRAYNWNPGFMRIYFKQINDHIVAEKSMGLYQELMEEDTISVLKNTTLLAPDYILAERNPISKEISYRPAIDLFDDYPYAYEIIKTEELGKRLLNQSGYFRFLVYTQAGDEKHITIYDNEGTLLYHQFQGNSHNLHDKDLKKLAKTID